MVDSSVNQQLDRGWVTAVFAAHRHLETWLGHPTGTGGRSHQGGDCLRVEMSEWVFGQESPAKVLTHQPPSEVVTTEPIDHLGKVICPEGEEVGMVCHIAGKQGGPRRLNHHPYRKNVSSRLPNLVTNPSTDQSHLGGSGNKGNHHSDAWMDAFRFSVSDCAHDRPDLHPIQALTDDGKAYAAGAEHWVVLTPFRGDAISKEFVERGV
tara:strand:+ start:2067 stop:2690 length:624 start_codon:yes stop_codon:yes gene_type:complete